MMKYICKLVRKFNVHSCESIPVQFHPNWRQICMIEIRTMFTVDTVNSTLFHEKNTWSKWETITLNTLPNDKLLRPLGRIKDFITGCWWMSYSILLNNQTFIQTQECGRLRDNFLAPQLYILDLVNIFNIVIRINSSRWKASQTLTPWWKAPGLKPNLT